MKRTLAGLSFAVAAVLALTLTARAQSPAFEVASVKPSNPNPGGGPMAGMPMVLPALGRLTAQNATLRILVMAAYQKQPFEIVGGPPWVNTDKFDITARAEDGTLSTDQILERLKGLLGDRFKLKLRNETRDVPIYALVMARDDRRFGPKLKASTDDCPDFKAQQQQQLEALAKGGVAALQQMIRPGEPRPCSIVPMPQAAQGAMGMKMSGQSLEVLRLLLTQLTGRPVVDKTGLTGAYDFELVIDLQTIMRVYQDLGINVPLPPGLPEGPSLTTYLQEELGLKLDAQRGPGQVLVIDSAEHPMPD